MMKCTIPEPLILFKPSVALINFIKRLELEPSVQLPGNLLSVYQAISKDDRDREVVQHTIPLTEYNDTDKSLLMDLCADSTQMLDFEQRLESLLVTKCDGNDIDTISSEEKSTNIEHIPTNGVASEHSKLTLNLVDLKWLNQYLANRRKANGSGEYLHELLKECQLILPQNAYIERNPVLEKRCERLRRQQEDQCYRAMTRNVDVSQAHIPDDTIAFQRKFCMHILLFR